MIGIGDAVLYQRVDSLQNIFARTRDDLRNHVHQKLVSVTDRAAVVRLEDKPSLGGGQAVPDIPVSLKVIAVGDRLGPRE